MLSKHFYMAWVFGAFLMFLLLLPTTVQAYDENGEAVCMAKNIYFEAGNQPLAGKVAVAQVVLNRMEHSAYADNVCGVIYQADIVRIGKATWYQSDINVSSVGIVMANQMNL